MFKNEKGELSFLTLLGVLFGSALIVSAVVLNSTDNPNNGVILNNTLTNTFIDNLSLINDSIVTNASLINETANLTIPIENIPLTNESTDITLPRDNLTLTNESSNSISNNTIGNQTYINEANNNTIINESNNSSLDFINNILLNNTLGINLSIMGNQSSNFGTLARIFNEDNLDFDRTLRKEYLNWYKNFSDLAFDRVGANSNFIVTVGARNENIKGININNNNYVFHLMYCDSYNRYCIFKLNGVPTKRLYSFKDFADAKVNSFDFDQVYRMKINSVEFDFCDNRRFCHLGYEGYHIVNVSIERKI